MTEAGTSTARCDAVLASLQAHGRLPSVVAGVPREGELAWTGALRGSLEEHSGIGSITKTVTAVAVMQLRDEGLLSLEDPIGRFVPETAGYAAATVGGLLAPTAGVQSEPVGSWWERSPASAGVDRPEPSRVLSELGDPDALGLLERHAPSAVRTVRRALQRVRRTAEV